MSTYTDLHNRVKENLTILRKPGSLDDGMTPQRVIFINPENQFYGTFNGTMNVSGGTLSDLTFHGGVIDGATIKDATFLDGTTPVQIGELAAASQEHEDKISVLEAQVDDLSAKQRTISSSINTLSQDLGDEIKKQISELQSSSGGDISALSGEISTLSSRLSSIDQLSLDLGTLSAYSLDHVVFHGDMTLAQTKYDRIGDLFQKVLCRCFGVATPVANGTLYRIAFDYDKLPSTLTKVSVYNEPGSTKFIELGDKDYILVKNHVKSEKSVDPMTMTVDDMNVIVQDLDFVRPDEFKDAIDALDKANASIRAEMSCVSAEAILTAKEYVDEKIAIVSVQTYMSAITDATDWSLSLDNKLSTWLSGELTKEISSKYVHLTGDHVDWISSDNLSVGKFLSKTLDVDSSDKVSIQTKDGMLISANSLSIYTVHNDGFKDVIVNEKSLASAFNEKLDVVEASAISSKLILSTDVDKKLSAFNDQLSIWYDSKHKQIWIGGKDYKLTSSIDASEFVKDGILSSVDLSTINGSPTLVFTWNTESGKDITCVNVSSLVDVYGAAGEGIELSANNHKFYLDFNKVASLSGLLSVDNRLTSLSSENQEYHKYLNTQIEEISVDSIRKLMFDGHLKFSELCAYGTVEDFFKGSGDFSGEQQLPYVKNGAVFNITFGSSIKNNCISVESDPPTIVCDGDVVVVHDHRNTRYVDISSLTFKDTNPSKKNAYLFKLGVSKYDLDTQISAKTEDISGISSWLNNKFEYPSESDGLSIKVSTLFEKDLHVSTDLSVANRIDSKTAKVQEITATNANIDGITTINISAGYISSTIISADHLLVNNSLCANVLSIIIDNKLIIPFDKTFDVDDVSCQSPLKKLLKELSTTIDSNISALSDTISSKIFIADKTTSYVDLSGKTKLSVISGEFDDLSVVKISADDYQNLVSNDAICSNILYVVEDNKINAYGQKIENLATPTELSDAANKSYVDGVSSSLSGCISSISDKLHGKIDSKIAIAQQTSCYVDSSGYTRLSLINWQYGDLSIAKITDDDYHQLVVDNDVVSNMLYVVSSENINAYGQRIVNLGNPNVSSDAASKQYVDDNVSTRATPHDVRSIVSSIVSAGNWYSKVYIEGQKKDLSITQVSYDEYVARLLSTSIALSDNVLYIVSSDNLNAFGGRVINVKDPELLNDAATKSYVDNAIDQKSNVYLCAFSISTDNDIPKLLSSEHKLDRFTIDKFDSYDAYQKYISDDNVISSSDFVIIERDQLDAESKQIINVARPLSSDCAANKAYVDEKFNEILTNTVLTKFFEDVDDTGDVSNITLDQALSVIFQLVKILRGSSN